MSNDAGTWVSGGVVVFLAGITEMRHALHTVPVRSRVVAALAVLATVPIGAAANIGLHLAVLVAVMVVMLVIDRRYHTVQTRGVPAS